MAQYQVRTIPTNTQDHKIRSAIDILLSSDSVKVTEPVVKLTECSPEVDVVMNKQGGICTRCNTMFKSRTSLINHIEHCLNNNEVNNNHNNNNHNNNNNNNNNNYDYYYDYDNNDDDDEDNNNNNNNNNNDDDDDDDYDTNESNVSAPVVRLQIKHHQIPTQIQQRIVQLQISQNNQLQLNQNKQQSGPKLIILPQ
jgi:hypothetical protein